MARIHPQDTVDVPMAARRNASYDCEFALEGVQAVAPERDSDPKAGQGSQDSDLADPPLGRLAGAVESLVAVSATFQLVTDEYGRPRLKGKARATVVMPCQRCLEGVELEVEAELGSVIWLGDESVVGQVKEAANDGLDVVLSKSSEMSYAALIEDDLLLALPQQVCRVDDCPKLPVLAFPAPGYTSATDSEAKGDELADDRQRPFAGLKDLLERSEETDR